MSVEEEVKNELQQLALTDWNKFLEVTGVNLSSLEICKRRKKGHTLQQIAKAMQMPRTTIANRCKTC